MRTRIGVCLGACVLWLVVATASARRPINRGSALLEVSDGVRQGQGLRERVLAESLSETGLLVDARHNSRLQHMKFKQTVYQRGDDANNEKQDRMWNTEVGKGGSTIVLSNRNKMRVRDPNRPSGAEAAEDEDILERKNGTEKLPVSGGLQVMSNIELADGWTAYGEDYAVPVARRWGVVCVVEGLVLGDAKAGNIIGTLPSFCHPGTRLVFTLLGPKSIPTRVDLLPDGQLAYVAGPKRGWLSLTGLHFNVMDGNPVRLLNGWNGYGHAYRSPQVFKQNELVLLSGLIRGNQFKHFFGRLPQNWQYPQFGRVVFSVNNHERDLRLDILRSGLFQTVLVKDAELPRPWLSLDGVMYSRVGGRRLSLVNGWTNYGEGYRPAMIDKMDHLCILSGVVRKVSHWGLITVLPAPCRPRKRLVFGCNTQNAMARVDVFPDGRVHYMSGRSKWNWLSLDGIVIWRLPENALTVGAAPRRSSASGHIPTVHVDTSAVSQGTSRNNGQHLVKVDVRGESTDDPQHQSKVVAV